MVRDHGRQAISARPHPETERDVRDGTVAVVAWRDYG
jgi:hypothetical protein